MKKVVILLTVLFSFVLSTYAVAKNIKDPDPAISGIIDLVIKGDFKRAGKMASSLEKKLRHLDQEGSQFILGYVKYKLGKFEDAKVYFSALVGKIPVIDDYVKYFLGESCLKTGDFECAVTSLKDVVSKNTGSVWFKDSLWGLSQAYFGSGKYSEAMNALAKLKPESFSKVTNSEYDLFKADILEKMGQKSRASLLLRDIYLDAESIKAMTEALARLRLMHAPEAAAAINYINSFPARVQAAEQMIKMYHYEDGLKILEDMYNERNDKHITEVLADAYFRSRNYGKAKGLYEKLVSKEASLFYLTRLAKSSARSNDFDTAIETYQNILKKYSKGGAKATYLYKLGFLYMDSNRYEEALEPFLELLNSKYDGTLRGELLWDIGWCYYKMDRFDDAILFFNKIADGRTKERATYWIARSNEKKGELALAKALYRSLVDEDRFGYYGFLAARRLNGGGGIPDEWVIYNETPKPEDAGKSFLPAGLDKAAYLSGLGLAELVPPETAKFNPGSIAGDGELASFMNFASENGAYRAAHLAAVWRLKDMLQQFPHENDLRRLAWNNWYPEAFAPYVEKFAREFDVDAMLIYAMMREESRFQSDVISIADAIGLMQIIPPTAEKLALALDHNPFELKEMFEPRVNIRFGVRYLGDLLRQFDGEKVYVIASYNAGEEAVSRWVKNSDAKDIEEFIEEIPYEETIEYVKRVLKSYWIYKELYKGSSPK